MSQPSFLASGTTPLRTDTRRTLWIKILGKHQNESGAVAANNPKRTDTLRTIKVKLDKALNV